MPEDFHGGRLIARRLSAHGVTRLFTVPDRGVARVLDGCTAEGVEVVAVGHARTAAFAAEGWAKVTRTLGVCALGAGTDVVDAIAAIAAAQASDTPLLLLAGGPDSAGAADLLELIAPLVRSAATATATTEIPDLIEDAIVAALSPRSGPVCVQLPLEHLLTAAPDPFTSWSLVPAPATGPEPGLGGGLRSGPGPALTDVTSAVALLSTSQRPVIVAGRGLYWGHGEVILADLAERHGIPVLLEGLARGSLAAAHPLVLSRARPDALAGADVAVMIGTEPGAGLGLAPDCQVIAVDVAVPHCDPPAAPAVLLCGDLYLALSGLSAAAPALDPDWLPGLRAVEDAVRAEETARRAEAGDGLTPAGVLGELGRLLDRDAIVICDGGAVLTGAPELIERSVPGCWPEPGPAGPLGTGPAYALAAALAFPGRQVLLLCDERAFGISGTEWETLARHDVAVLSVLITGAAPGARYDQVVRALGGRGQAVTLPGRLPGAVTRALASGRPTLITLAT